MIGPAPETDLRIPVSAPRITAAARAYVAEALDSGWISSGGPFVARFEQAFAAFIGVRHAVATGSGTTALHLALAALDIGPGDEVIVPDFTMIAPVCAVLYTGATPVFVDCHPETLTLDPDGLAAALTPRTRAILPVHIYGHSADMDPICAFARARGLAVIEDAAEAHGATYRGRRCGALGDVAAFSFYANKIVTTGEGGMVVTDDAALAARARRLGSMAHAPERRFVHDALGFSYRMSALQAACGLGQLEHVDEFLQQRRWMAAAYDRRLAGLAGLHRPVTMPWAGNVHWMYAVQVDDGFPLSRDALCVALRKRGIETRDFFAPASQQPFLQGRGWPQGPFKASTEASERGFYLPSGLALTAAEIDAVSDALAEIAE